MSTNYPGIVSRRREKHSCVDNFATNSNFYILQFAYGKYDAISFCILRVLRTEIDGGHCQNYQNVRREPSKRLGLGI